MKGQPELPYNPGWPGYEAFAKGWIDETDDGIGFVVYHGSQAGHFFSTTLDKLEIAQKRGLVATWEPCEGGDGILIERVATPKKVREGLS